MRDTKAISQPDAVEQAEQRRLAAFARMTEIEASFATAKQSLADCAPAKAVAAGLTPAAAAAAFSEAENAAGFLADMADAARTAHFRAQAEVNSARIHRDWMPRLEDGITKRLASLAEIHRLRAALQGAEADYATASLQIAGAFGAGIERPGWMARGQRLDEAHAPDHRPLPQYRSVEEEIWLWRTGA